MRAYINLNVSVCVLLKLNADSPASHWEFIVKEKNYWTHFNFNISLIHSFSSDCTTLLSSDQISQHQRWKKRKFTWARCTCLQHLHCSHEHNSSQAAATTRQSSIHLQPRLTVMDIFLFKHETQFQLTTQNLSFWHKMYFVTAFLFKKLKQHPENSREDESQKKRVPVRTSFSWFHITYSLPISRHSIFFLHKSKHKVFIP